MWIGREYYFKNLLATTYCYEKAQMACVPREVLQDTKVKGLTYTKFQAVDARNVFWIQQYTCRYMHRRAYAYIIYLLPTYLFSEHVNL